MGLFGFKSKQDETDKNVDYIQMTNSLSQLKPQTDLLQRKMTQARRIHSALLEEKKQVHSLMIKMPKSDEIDTPDYKDGLQKLSRIIKNEKELSRILLYGIPRAIQVAQAVRQKLDALHTKSSIMRDYKALEKFLDNSHTTNVEVNRLLEEQQKLLNIMLNEKKPQASGVRVDFESLIDTEIHKYEMLSKSSEIVRVLSLKKKAADMMQKLSAFSKGMGGGAIASPVLMAWFSQAMTSPEAVMLAILLASIMGGIMNIGLQSMEEDVRPFISQSAG